MQDGMPIDEPSYLDPATTEFIGHFKRDFKLHGVPDVSGQFDHHRRALKATAGYSAVYVTHLARPGAQSIQVCYKELRPPASDSPEQVGLTKKTIKRLTHEVRVWKNLDHANIIKFIGYAVEGERSEMRAILVSKWCNNGNIVDYLRKARESMTESTRMQLIQDIANGLQYLHTQRPVIIHGDLKPDNILISDEGTAQLCDFGLSRILQEFSRTGPTTSTTPGLSVRYSACEVIVEGSKTAKSDVYAFGCTCIYVLFNQHPFPRLNNEYKLFRAIGDRQSPWEWDRTVPLQKILSECCQIEENSRPLIADVLQKLGLIINPISDNLAQVTISEVQVRWGSARTNPGSPDDLVPNTGPQEGLERNFLEPHPSSSPHNSTSQTNQAAPSIANLSTPIPSGGSGNIGSSSRQTQAHAALTQSRQAPDRATEDVAVAAEDVARTAEDIARHFPENIAYCVPDVSGLSSYAARRNASLARHFADLMRDYPRHIPDNTCIPDLVYRLVHSIEVDDRHDFDTYGSVRNPTLSNAVQHLLDVAQRVPGTRLKDTG